jgi:hypothetical protein
MSHIVKVSAHAMEVCKANYHGWEKKLNGCHRCPIQKECCCGCLLTHEALNDYTNKLNAAADKVAL